MKKNDLEIIFIFSFSLATKWIQDLRINVKICRSREKLDIVFMPTIIMCIQEFL